MAQRCLGLTECRSSEVSGSGNRGFVIAAAVVGVLFAPPPQMDPNELLTRQLNEDIQEAPPFSPSLASRPTIFMLVE